MSYIRGLARYATFIALLYGVEALVDGNKVHIAVYLVIAFASSIGWSDE